MKDMSDADAGAFIRTAIDAGANFFDHADIYGGGACESKFASAVGMNPTLREQMIIQSKCGIVPGIMYDFSKEYILEAVDGILRRLRTEYLDVLLLHRPDALVEPEEVAEAFDKLQKQGKVRHFGVSNQKPMQIEYLRKYVCQPIVANQLQLSVPFAGMISQGLHVNMQDAESVDHDGSILDYCRLNDITIQPWSPFQYGFFEGVFLGCEKYPELNQVIDKLAEKYGVSNTAIAIAWLLRHPAKFQPVTGTMNARRLLECVDGTRVELTRIEWYNVLTAAGYTLP